MYNSKNNGSIIGTILPESKGSSAAMHEFPFHSDGSQRIAMTVSVSDNFTSRYSQDEYNAMAENVKKARRVTVGADGTIRGYKSQTVGFEQYLPAGDAGVRIRNRYKGLNPGDLVKVDFSVRTNSWVGEDGKTNFKQWLEIDEITTLKKVTPKAAPATPAAAPAAAPAGDNGVAAGAPDLF